MVPDASKDERFMHSSLVTGPPRIRFYAGAPLDYEDANKNQFKLGTLCIIDTTLRTLTDEEKILLQTLARLVVAEIQLRDKISVEHKRALDEAKAGAEEVVNEII